MLEDEIIETHQLSSSSHNKELLAILMNEGFILA
jgi:hypothetical protein